MTPVWHRLKLEGDREVLSGRKAAAPGAGVWVACLSREDGGQTTTEAIAVDGVIIDSRVCYCGEDRARSFRVAGSFLRGKR